MQSAILQRFYLNDLLIIQSDKLNRITEKLWGKELTQGPSVAVEVVQKFVAQSFNH